MNLPMLPHVLAGAIIRLGVRSDRGLSPFFIKFDGIVWRHLESSLRDACFQIIARSEPDSNPDVALVKRAVKNLVQAGEIHWDTPETPEEIAGHEPFAVALAIHKNKLSRAEISAKKRKEIWTVKILTPEQKAALRAPGKLPKVVSSMIVDSLPLLRPTLRPFTIWDCKIHWRDYEPSINRMITLGIIDVIEPITETSITAAPVQLGPRYLAYMERFEKRPNFLNDRFGEGWTRFAQSLREKWA